MRRTDRRLTIAASLLVAALTTSPATAELYRCSGPNGNVVFTDDASTCPGAPTHEPAGAVQTHSSRGLPAARAGGPTANRRANSPDPGEQLAMKRHWQAEKRKKEAELSAVEEKIEYLSRYVTGCNRGSEIIRRDEFGIGQRVPCDEIRADYEQALALREPLRDYLENGLPRACRQAGCLPGWIR